MKLLGNEKLVKDFKKAYISVTSKRVRYEDTSSGHTIITSMTLDSVASCGVVTESYPSFLLFGFIAMVGGILVEVDNLRLLLIAVAFVMFIAYFLTRKAVISIASNGGDKITVPVSSVKKDTIVDIVDTIEEYKLKIVDKLG